MKSIQSNFVSAVVCLIAWPVSAADSPVSGGIANNPGAASKGTSAGQTAAGTSLNAAPTGAGSAAATATAPVKMPGFYITGGRVYRIENGRATPVTTPQIMRIGPGGLIGFDGQPMPIPKGQMIGVDGRLVPLPSNVTGLPVPAENVSGTTTLAEAAAAIPAAGAKAPAAPAVVEQVKPALPDEGTTGEDGTKRP